MVSLWNLGFAVTCKNCLTISYKAFFKKIQVDQGCVKFLLPLPLPTPKPEHLTEQGFKLPDDVQLSKENEQKLQVYYNLLKSYYYRDNNINF